MVSLLPKRSRRIVTHWMKNILLVVLAHIIRMVLLNGIWKQLSNGLGPTCCILLIIGQVKPMSASGRRQLSMPYGFSTGCLTLKMAYRQMNFGHLVDLQLRNLIMPMCLAVRSMFLMQPFKMGTRYLNRHHVLVLEFFLDSRLCTHPRCPPW